MDPDACCSSWNLDIVFTCFLLNKNRMWNHVQLLYFLKGVGVEHILRRDPRKIMDWAYQVLPSMAKRFLRFAVDIHHQGTP